MAKQSVLIKGHSEFPDGTRAVTFQLRYWRAIHAEFMTHRVFSRNASSSRAIPVRKVLAQVWNDAAGPTYWGSNKPGMQAGAELTGWRRTLAPKIWNVAGKAACLFAWCLMKLGVHKQIANRLLEAFQYISVVATATELENFYALRCHPAAMPEFRDLALGMRDAERGSTPVKLKGGEWHLPYITADERAKWSIGTLLKVDTARCARVSYERHDGTPAPIREDIGLHDKLVGGEPIHASPTEHQIMCAHFPVPFNTANGNLTGKYTVQYRKLVENNVLKHHYMGSGK